MSSLAFPTRNRDRSSDNNALIKQIEATHSPDNSELDVKPLLQIVEDVLHRATPTINGVRLTAKTCLESLDETALGSNKEDLLKILSRTIYKISCELTCRCSMGGDADSSTIFILSNLLSNYKWDAKIAISLAAFSVLYGEFWLDIQLYNSNYLAKGIALLKQLPTVPEQRDGLKIKLESITKLIQSMLDVSKCIVEFKELPSQYISQQDTQELASAVAYIPLAVYWSIRAAIACASQIVGLIGSRDEHNIESTQESWELLSLLHKLNSIHDHLTTQLVACHKHISHRKYIEAYQSLSRLFNTPHLDNSKIIKALFVDEESLFDCSAKKKVNVTILRRKVVIFLVSDINISQNELMILNQIYEESRQLQSHGQYNVVWLPIVADYSSSWTDEMEKRFLMIQEKMSWYSVHPSMIELGVVKYVKDDLGFNKKPMMVVLDQQGAIVNENSMHMMMIWGNLGYPFTTGHEDNMWRDASWRIDLLADSVEPNIFNWIQNDQYICLYGGEDIDWIRKITNTTKEVSRFAGISLEMLYVGKSNPGNRIRNNIRTIQTENLSHTLQDLTTMWFFWTRLESMWYSKTKNKKNKKFDQEDIISNQNDLIMKEIMTMLAFDGSEEGWVVICFRAVEMAKAKGEMMMKCLVDYQVWIDFVATKGFVGAINEYLKEIRTEHHCNRLVLPGSQTGVPERVVCSECGKTMEKFVMYRCCTD